MGLYEVGSNGMSTATASALGAVLVLRKTAYIYVWTNTARQCYNMEMISRAVRRQDFLDGLSPQNIKDSFLEQELT